MKSPRLLGTAGMAALALFLGCKPGRAAPDEPGGGIAWNEAAISVVHMGSQIWMARETAALQKALDCGLWHVGYGELREKGLFAAYARELGLQYATATGKKPADAVRLYQHFSMNRFTIDLGERGNPYLSLGENLRAIGLAHRAEILGW